METKETYSSIMQEAQEMRLSLSPQFLSLLQKHLGIQDSEQQPLTIDPVRLRKALAVSTCNIAYTVVHPYATLFVQESNGFYRVWVQTIPGHSPVHKSTCMGGFENLQGLYLNEFDVSANADIWYPDTLFEEQDCIHTIAFGKKQPKKFLEWFS